jgi:hypothetical protein
MAVKNFMLTSAKAGKLTFLWVVAGLSLMALVGAAPAAAAAPWWQLTSSVAPTNLPPGGEGEVLASAANIGDAEASGEPVTIRDTLPAGLAVQSVSFFLFTPVESEFGNEDDLKSRCSTVLSEVTCSFPANLRSLQPYQRLEIRITVKVETDAPLKADNEVTVDGGEAPRASIRRPVTVQGGPTPFGVESYQLTPENEGGSLDTQAGSHPFQLTTTLGLNQAFTLDRGLNVLEPTAPALVKDLHFNLPPGLVGNPTPIPQCTDLDFTSRLARDPQHNLCPPNTAVGVASVTINEPHSLRLFTRQVPLFNLVPSVGEPVRFGFDVVGNLVTLDTSVRTGGDYGVVVSVNNISQSVNFLSTQVTFWGVPGDPLHDQSRGWECLLGEPGCSPLGQEHPLPFLTLPTSCTGSLETSVEGDSWAQPNFLTSGPDEPEESLDGCDRLGFEPSIRVAPDGQEASTPTGLTVDVHVPQEVSLDPAGLAGADVKDLTVALPEGVAINPAGADGLEACSEVEIGYEPGKSTPPGDLRFTSGLPAPKEAPPQPFCPDASKVGTAKITTPILPHPIEGAVYLAAQNENPFGSLVAMYIVAEDPVSGVLLKLPGEVSLNQATGRITATFSNTPQAPFEDAELHFFGGSRAPLATPSRCGMYTTEASIAPWSGNPPANPSSSFDITSGPNGGPCANPLPFTPSLAAGTTSNQAGGFSTFTTTFSREDGNQNLKSIQLHMPPGLSGMLTGIPLCPEAQADAGTCPAASLIGETTVSVGLGGNPFSVKGGEVFLTEKYEGAPFGLSIVNPAVAGPFNLGKVVVRAKIEVDPHTAQLTITSDPSGPYAIPPMLDGIPLQIKHVNVTINRPGFTFNPTSCNPMAITGTLSSIEGSTSALSVPLQVTNCAVLAFKPGLEVSTAGKTSRADGASLAVKLTYPKAPQGSEANIARVKVDLPKQLPSRLTTLQKACTAAVFEANPANCPAASNVGHAKATTPIIPVPLEGPAYFVSHGGEAFPSLIVVLQGYGVTVDLVGTTFISHVGITSSTFKTVPDVPVGSFELNLPEGKFSALAANGNLCKSKLAMPTAFVAQNGVEIHVSTKIGVTGCPRAKKAAKKKAKRKAVGKGKKGKRG